MIADPIQTLSLLTTTSFTLDYYFILTGSGHVTVRDPLNIGTFFMEGSQPALVSFPGDLNEFYIEDASPVNASDSNQYLHPKRFIHKEILKHFPNQNSVVYSRTRRVILFAMAGV